MSREVTDHGAIGTFGELLKHLRRRARLTQQELGTAVGYSYAHIARLESGQRRPDPSAVRARFIEVLDLQHEPALAQRLVELAEQEQGDRPRHPENDSHAADAPPLAAAITPAGVPTNLPTQLTHFIGRGQDIAEVLHLIASNRLVTLTGSGGVGKTRLAIEVGATLVGAITWAAQPGAAAWAAVGYLPSFPDGVWLAELASISERELLPNVLVGLFGLTAGTRTAHEVLIDHLRSRRLLLVLDNCEHQITACAELAEALLRACPHLHVLATSREALNIPAELAWRVPSLTPGEAAQLFEERARAASPQFRVTSQNAWGVARVCARLDHIPLAIELAAARVRTFTVEQIEARLGDVFRLFTAGSRTALPRHQTLWALIDWSYNLLPDPERRLLRRLSVFAGGWTLEAAEAVCADTAMPKADPDRPRPAMPHRDAIEAPDIPALLHQLVSKSLIDVEQSGDETRYTMLETIRQYAHERLDQAGEHEVLRRCHLTYFCALTDQVNWKLPGIQYLAGYEQVQADMDNIRVALEWVLQSGDQRAGVRLVDNLSAFWGDQGLALEGLHWAEAILPDERSTRDPGTLAHTHLFLGVLHGNHGDLGKAYQHHIATLPLAYQAEDYTLIKMALWSLSGVSPDTSEAFAFADELLRMVREDERAEATAFMDYILGGRARREGDHAQAARRLQAAEAAMRVMGNTVMMGAVIGETAFLARDQGDLATARSRWEQALAIFRQANVPTFRVNALLELTPILVRQGDAAAALPMVKECLDSFYKTDNMERLGETIAAAAGVAHARGEMPRAATLLSAADALWQRVGQFPVFMADERAEYERLLPLVHAALPPDEFHTAWAEGERMTLDQIIADVMAM